MSKLGIDFDQIEMEMNLKEDGQICFYGAELLHDENALSYCNLS